MANTFTATATRCFLFGGPNWHERLRVEGVLVVDTTASGGAAKGDLPASLFGLSSITAGIGIVNDDQTKVWPIMPCYDGTSLMVGGGTAGAVMDLPNDTYRLVIEGIR